jgi:hypothetical protein
MLLKINVVSVWQVGKNRSQEPGVRSQKSEFRTKSICSPPAAFFLLPTAVAGGMWGRTLWTVNPGL